MPRLKGSAGLYWHVHHLVLMEYSNDIDERKCYVMDAKPPDEVAIRLRLMKRVKGKLPPRVDKAYSAVVKAHKAYDRAADITIWPHPNMYVAKDRITKARITKARIASEKYQAYLAAEHKLNIALGKDKLGIAALHKKECKNCPWNGWTIFPGK